MFLLTHDNLINKRKRIENKPQNKLYYKQYNVTNKFEKKKNKRSLFFINNNKCGMKRRKLI